LFCWLTGRRKSEEKDFLTQEDSVKMAKQAEREAKQAEKEAQEATEQAGKGGKGKGGKAGAGPTPKEGKLPKEKKEKKSKAPKPNADAPATDNPTEDRATGLTEPPANEVLAGGDKPKKKKKEPKKPKQGTLDLDAQTEGSTTEEGEAEPATGEAGDELPEIGDDGKPKKKMRAVEKDVYVYFAFYSEYAEIGQLPKVFESRCQFLKGVVDKTDSLPAFRKMRRMWAQKIDSLTKVVVKADTATLDQVKLMEEYIRNYEERYHQYYLYRDFKKALRNKKKVAKFFLSSHLYSKNLKYNILPMPWGLPKFPADEEEPEPGSDKQKSAKGYTDKTSADKSKKNRAKKLSKKAEKAPKPQLE
jgi:hypothetical protein